MLTSLSRNLVLFAVVVPIVLSYLGFFGSYFIHFLQTLAFLVICMLSFNFFLISFGVAYKRTRIPDPAMDGVSGACINKKRLLPKGAASHLVFALYFNDCPEIDELKTSLNDLFSYARFASIPVAADYAIESTWRELEKNDINDHVFVYDIQSAQEGERQVQDIMRGTLRPLDTSKPLWRVDLLRNATGPSVVVWIIDHCIGDGFGLLPIALKWATTEDDQPAEVNLPQLPKKRLNAGKKQLECHGNYDIASFECEFSEILQIKDLSKAKLDKVITVNDVITALFAGALRKYLERNGDPILKAKDILIRGQAPVAQPKRIPGEVRNDFIFAPFKFPVAGDTPQKRLLMAHEEFHGLKNSLKVPIIQSVVKLGLRLGLDALLADTNIRQMHRTSFVFSNVPGPKERVKLFKKPLLTFRAYFCNVIHQVIACTYAGKCNFSMVIDTTNIAQPQALQDCFREELKETLATFM